MKLRLKKTGKLFLVADVVSSAAFARLEDGVYNCTVTKPRVKSLPDELRRAAQNRLYWQVLHDLEKTSVNHLAGNVEAYWHRKFKIDYMVPILLRESETFPVMFAALEEVLLSMGKETYENIYNGIIDELSTTKLKVRQFAEYLTHIMRYCRMEGVILTVDSDLIDMATQYT